MDRRRRRPLHLQREPSSPFLPTRLLLLLLGSTLPSPHPHARRLLPRTRRGEAPPKQPPLLRARRRRRSLQTLPPPGISVWLTTGFFFPFSRVLPLINLLRFRTILPRPVAYRLLARGGLVGWEVVLLICLRVELLVDDSCAVLALAGAPLLSLSLSRAAAEEASLPRGARWSVTASTTASGNQSQPSPLCARRARAHGR